MDAMLRAGDQVKCSASLITTIKGRNCGPGVRRSSPKWPRKPGPGLCFLIIMSGVKLHEMRGFLVSSLNWLIVHRETSYNEASVDLTAVMDFVPPAAPLTF
jgi:hypothetical protein